MDLYLSIDKEVMAANSLTITDTASVVSPDIHSGIFGVENLAGMGSPVVNTDNSGSLHSAGFSLNTSPPA